MKEVKFNFDGKNFIVDLDQIRNLNEFNVHRMYVAIEEFHKMKQESVKMNLQYAYDRVYVHNVTKDKYYWQNGKFENMNLDINSPTSQPNPPHTLTW